MLRIAAVLAGLLFAAALFFGLLMQALSTTLASPAFYPELLERAEVYDFVMTDLVDAVIEDSQQLEPADFGEDFQENPVAASGLTTQEIADALRRAIPPEELEAIVSPVVRQTAEYVLGERDEITVTLDLGTHLDATVRELSALLRESGAYERLLSDEFEPRFGEWADKALPPDHADSGWTSFLSGGDEPAADSLLQVFTSVVTPEWLADQVEHSADEFTGYLVGRSDGFEIRIELDDAQAEAAAGELAAILRDADAYDLAQETVIEPAVEEHVGASVELPYGVTLTREEVLVALREAVSPAWADRQADALALDVSDYLTGRTDAFTTEVDIASVKDDAEAALTDTALATIETALDDLAVCATRAEIAAAQAAGTDELPSCLPPGTTASEIASEARPAVAAAIAEFVAEPVPDTVALTEANLLSAVPGDEALGDLRNLFQAGWTYTDEDLRADLSEDDREVLDDLRTLLTDGYVIEVATEDRPEWEESLDGTRMVADGIGQARWTAFAIAALLLIGVGALGGTSWRGRVAWGAGALLVAAGLVAIVWGPVYQAVSDAAIEGVREEIAANLDSDFALTSGLVADKLLDLTVMVVDEVAASMVRNSIILAAVGAVALGVSLSWERIAQATGRGRS
jgi:hypothetical protein